MIRIKRAYEQPARADGHRVLIDRLWPRGVSKATAQLDEWLKDLAPSEQLRKWFAHDPDRFPEFRTRYRKELSQPAARALLRALAARARRGTVTLVYAAHDQHHNDAVVLASVLQRRLSRAARATPRSADGPGS
jgi:uncharacterized protein YeaO (DUF488 family)